MDRWMQFTLLNENERGIAGLITYGALDTTNCDQNVKYVPLTSQTYWQFSIEGFSVGGFSEKKAEDVISDTGNSFIRAPLYIVKEIANQTGARFSQRFGIFIVECSTTVAQPDLEFSINGVKYHVPSKEYVMDFGLGSGMCGLAIFPSDSGGFGPSWILGDPWIRTYCNIHDFGQKRIGFAKAKHSKS
ncbi:Inositol hexakisphosphate and diphosphoinositol-pentakisphosphate kinase [Parelaphostrongylus tenuis]|uniref:Inositol hexakisphosphate and diphosphoinositol-pentakisphosphate kinase n=1 Tax=Parelaphostrongylus tenuis TaxID=148309 RepID=A0AAD5MGQ1_PARTN|nr:Inositol hexakisphosphate and diphosphoinositol-pentakisphosphate kinase [Parelaphostrongylus tenuis]